MLNLKTTLKTIKKTLFNYYVLWQCYLCPAHFQLKSLGAQNFYTFLISYLDIKLCIHFTGKALTQWSCSRRTFSEACSRWFCGWPTLLSSSISSIKKCLACCMGFHEWRRQRRKIAWVIILQKSTIIKSNSDDILHYRPIISLSTCSWKLFWNCACLLCGLPVRRP